MATVIMDRNYAELLRQQRAAAGADRWDEVWEGTYMMAPLPNIEHQQIVNRLCSIFEFVVGWEHGAIILPGANVSDRVKGWEHNYRCPDVAVYLPGNPSRNCDTHWHGGPDFAVEISSEDDRTRDKIPFYAKVGTRELLIVDRDPWQIELFRLTRKTLKSAGKVTIKSRISLSSRVLPLSFRLMGGGERPVIRVTHTTDGRVWDV
jgi:Uma2 family endonuclease